MITLSLDLSMSSSGYSIFEDDRIIGFGLIKPERYPGDCKDRYPKRSIKNISSVSEQILGLIINTNPDVIVIEEINSSGRKNIIGGKGLSGLHYMLCYQMLCYDETLIDKIKYITSSQWRSLLGIKKTGDWKQSAVNYVNSKLSTSFTRDDNDITDSICCFFASNMLRSN